MKGLPQLLLLFCFIASWSGLGLQLGILVANTPENGMTVFGAVAHFFRYFTILSNLWVAVTCALLLFRTSVSFFIQPASLSAAAVYIFIVAVVYNVVLRRLWDPTGLQWVVDNLLHVLVPLLYLMCWWNFPKKPVSWKWAFRWLWFPAAYLIYALLRGAIDGVYPYPFIDLKELGAGRLLINVAGMLLLFLFTGFALLGISRWQQKRSS